MSLLRSASSAIIALTSSAFLISAAPALETQSTAAPGFTKITSPELNKLWSARPLAPSLKKTVVEFKLNADGSIAGGAEAARVFQSSGSREMDDYALECIKKAAPYNLSTTEKKSLVEHDNICLAKMDIGRNVAFFSGKYFVNYDCYAIAVQNKIKPLWLTIESKKARRLECRFIAHKNGDIQNSEIVKMSGDRLFDQACLRAIWSIKPVTNVPPAAPDSIPTTIIFQFDPIGAVHKTEIWVDGILRSTESSVVPVRFELPEGDEKQATSENQTADNNQTESEYLRSMQRKIRANWHSIKSDESYKVKCIFSLNASGKLLHSKIVDAQKTLSEKEAACLLAVTSTAPFEPVPEALAKKMKGTLDIEFTFDYNVRPTSQTGPRTKKVVEKTEAVPPYMAPYLLQVHNKIEAAWHRKAEWQEDEALMINIGRDGSLQSFELKIVTGNNEEDAALIDAVKKAAPFMPLPKEAGKSYCARLKFALPKSTK